MAKEDGSSSVWHWFTTQLLNIPISLIIIFATWGSISAGGRDSLNLAVYLIPVYIIFAVALYYTFWKPDQDCQCCLLFVSTCSCFLLIIFFAIYFSVFYQVLKYTYLPATECKMLNVTAIKVNTTENYVLINTRFNDVNNITQYGYGCASDQSRSTMSYKKPYPYKFYKKGDTMNCRRRLRALRVGGGSSGGSRSSGYSSGGSSSGDSSSAFDSGTDTGLASDGSSTSQPACTFTYSQSQVKIADWMCLDISEVVQNVDNNKCFYTIYGQASIALANSNPYTDISSIQDFYMMNWRSSSYYDQASLICLIIFCLIPGSFCTCQGLLVYAANELEEPIEKVEPMPIKITNISAKELEQANNDRQQQIVNPLPLQIYTPQNPLSKDQIYQDQYPQFQQFGQPNLQQTLYNNQLQNYIPMQVLAQTQDKLDANQQPQTNYNPQYQQIGYTAINPTDDNPYQQNREYFRPPPNPMLEQ